jgi:diacylglycerol diphosphate phosphatase/phosphatidate phosphatase
VPPPHSNTNSRISFALMSFVPTSPETTLPSLSRKHARRRGWVTYFRVTWLEYLGLIVVAGLTLGVYCTPMFSKDHRVVSLVPSINLSNKDQPFQEFQVPMDISHPWVKEPIPTFGCALVVVFVPLLVIGIFQIKTRSLWDLHAGVMGVLKALVST